MKLSSEDSSVDADQCSHSYMHLSSLRYVPSWLVHLQESIFTALGGVPGKHNAQRPKFFTPTRVLLLVAVFALALSWLLKQGCVQQMRVGKVLQLITDGNRPFTAMCYTDLTVYFDKAQGLGMSFPFESGVRIDPWMQPCAPLIKIAIFCIIALTRFLYPLLSALGLPVGLPVVLFFGISCVIISVLWIAIIFMVREMLPFDEKVSTQFSYLLAFSPVAIIQVFTNYDVIPVFLGVLGLYLFSQKRIKCSGIALGIGISASLYCGIIVLAMMLMWWVYKTRDHLKTVALSLLSAFVILGTLALLQVSALAGTYEAMFQAHEDTDSIYASIQNIFGYTNFDDTNNAFVINIVVALLTVFILGWEVAVIKNSVSPDIYQIALLLVCGLLVTGKMFKPQASLWILPLLILGSTHSKLILSWMVFDASSWFVRCGALLSDFDRKGLTFQFYGFFSVARVLFVIVIMIVTAIDMLHLIFIVRGRRICLVHKSTDSGAKNLNVQSSTEVESLPTLDL